jgi:acyl carrier protein
MKSAVLRAGVVFGMAVIAAPVLNRIAVGAGYGTVLFAGPAFAQAVPAAPFERVQAIIAEQLGVDRPVVTPDADIFLDFGADELDLIEIVMAMEDEFDIALSDEVVEGLATVGDLVAAVQAAGAR